MTTSKCRVCGKDIVWATTPNGNNMPLDAQTITMWIVDAEGAQQGSPKAKPVQVRVSHFKSCPPFPGRPG